MDPEDTEDATPSKKKRAEGKASTMWHTQMQSEDKNKAIDDQGYYKHSPLNFPCSANPYLRAVSANVYQHIISCRDVKVVEVWNCIKPQESSDIEQAKFETVVDEEGNLISQKEIKMGLHIGFKHPDQFYKALLVYMSIYLQAYLDMLCNMLKYFIYMQDKRRFLNVEGLVQLDTKMHALMVSQHNTKKWDMQ